MYSVASFKSFLPQFGSGKFAPIEEEITAIQILKKLIQQKIVTPI
jgi:hypothetical protein